MDEHEGHGHDPDLFEFRNAVETTGTDTYSGIFGGVGFGLMYYDVRWNDWRLGDIALEAEVEFTHDWIDLRGFQDNGLSTVVGMLTASFLR